MARRPAKKGTKITVNMSSSGLLEEGSQHEAVLSSVELKTSVNSGFDYLAAVFEVDDKKIWHNFSLQPHALFNLRNYLEALGYEIEDGDMDIDIDQFIGDPVGVEVGIDEYQGNKKNVVNSFIALDEESEGEEEEEPEEEEEEPEPTPKKKAAAKKTPAKKAPAKKTPARKKKNSIEVGSIVSFESEDGDLSGEVLAVKGSMVTVDVDEEEWTVDVDSLTLEA